MANVLPAVTGLRAQYIGAAGGSTTRYYQVQAIYPDGRSGWASVTITSTPASLDANNAVNLTWNPMPGSIGYDVVQTASAATPTTGTIAEAVGHTYNAFTDRGAALFSYTVVGPTAYLATSSFVQTAHFKYDFAVDGGATAIPSVSDTIPAGAVLGKGKVIALASCTAGGSATVAIGLSAGAAANSLLTATAIASLASGNIVDFATGTTGIQTSAGGQIKLTIATGPLTAGVLEGWVEYYPAASVAA